VLTDDLTPTDLQARTIGVAAIQKQVGNVVSASIASVNSSLQDFAASGNSNYTYSSLVLGACCLAWCYDSGPSLRIIAMT
jgi:hypothetical protein